MQTAAGGSAGNRGVVVIEHVKRFTILDSEFITGFVEVCIMHPLDLIKTRLQLQIKSANISAQTGSNVSEPFIIIHFYFIESISGLLQRSL